MTLLLYSLQRNYYLIDGTSIFIIPLKDTLIYSNGKTLPQKITTMFPTINTSKC